MITVRPAPLDVETSLRLIHALNGELSGRYPEEGATHFRLDLDEVAPGRGTFLIAEEDGRAVGCGAVRRLLEPGLDDAAEVKRMYVVPEARGRGVGGFVLAALEREARSLGVTRVLLERGERQPEASALHRRFGFEVIDRFGEYAASPLSICMEKRLTPLTVHRVPVDSPHAVALQQAMAAEVATRYEDDSPPLPLDPAEVAPGHGAFFLVEDAGEVVGCGALRRLAAPSLEDAAEVKRMYVTLGACGRGVARLLLGTIEAEAQRLGVARMVLETGDRQPEAIALYTRAGFEVIPRYGEPWTHPLSIFMEKRLN